MVQVVYQLIQVRPQLQVAPLLQDQMVQVVLVQIVVLQQLQVALLQVVRLDLQV